MFFQAEEQELFFPQPKWYIIRKCVFLIKDGLQIRKGENK